MANDKKNQFSDIDAYNAQTHIVIKGARVHNLKNVNIALPRNKMIVVTGVSGSGKSSLTMDTLYAEGQRRYVESLSSYARQFMTRLDKPDVDYIKGICPAIAIEQRVSARTTRSTVGTMTEIYDFLRLLYARIGKTYSPISGVEVKKHDVQDVVDAVLKYADDDVVMITTPITINKGRKIDDELSILLQKGFSRIWDKNANAPLKIEDLLAQAGKHKLKAADVSILIDRITVQHDDDTIARIADSVQTAFTEGDGIAIVYHPAKKEGTYDTLQFSNKFEADGMTFEIPTAQFFSYSNPYGACKTCEGFGSVLGINPELVFPDRSSSVYENAIAPWRGDKMQEWNNTLIRNASKFDFPIHKPIKDLTVEQYDVLWKGNAYFHGLNAFFKHLESQTYKIQYRVMLSRYRGRTVCPDCHGTRLRKDAGYVKINGKSIMELVLMQIDTVLPYFKNLQLTPHEQQVANRLLTEINQRLQLMCEVGLGYLTLNRLSNTLSGGETQRIHLTRLLGSNLTQSLYILDEPSIGLHPRDIEQLIKVIKQLRDLKNTVVIVEHEEAMMRAADVIVDMGPAAGTLGGEVIAAGNYDEIIKNPDSLTGQYLSGKLSIDMPGTRRKMINKLQLKGVTLHNLKNINATFPLNALTVVTGVSGSGKTSLIKGVLYPAMMVATNASTEQVSHYDELTGDVSRISQVEMIDQDPIGKSSRSNPVTYVKAYDHIRDIYAAQTLSRARGYTSRYFSFNVEGGRCETCKGEGERTVEMQFLADVHLVCEECHGRRFREEVLEVQYKGRNIFEVLEMTVDEALKFFKEETNLYTNLLPLQRVGLGYVKLGQSSDTLSGGEAQRVKLASFLVKGAATKPVLFIFDEPTTGLHFHDIKKLLGAFNALIEKGHSIIVIEHNMEIIRQADWVIDLGPEGGVAGGNLLYEGIPEGLVDIKESYTGKYLKGKL